ncbi:MAG TPA: DUF4440 domain-containing protein [Chitinophagaceae bacterium]|nr:DUF4440 domain-containing protein [Chitinophagaceae bacterium]
MKKTWLFPFFSVLFLASCGGSKVMDMSKEVNDIRQTDLDFSGFSKTNGMKAAFLKYADSNTVLLRSNHSPLAGADAFAYLRSLPDSGFTLTWVPTMAEMAASGDLGYTYGIYTFAGRDTTYQGTYVSIWKRQQDGSWRFVLDSGNPGLGAKIK